jgi:hypothetical protein
MPPTPWAAKRSMAVSMGQGLVVMVWMHSFDVSENSCGISLNFWAGKRG